MRSRRTSHRAGHRPRLAGSVLWHRARSPYRHEWCHALVRLRRSPEAAAPSGRLSSRSASPRRRNAAAARASAVLGASADATRSGTQRRRRRSVGDSAALRSRPGAGMQRTAGGGVVRQRQARLGGDSGSIRRVPHALVSQTPACTRSCLHPATPAHCSSETRPRTVSRHMGLRAQRRSRAIAHQPCRTLTRPRLGRCASGGRSAVGQSPLATTGPTQRLTHLHVRAQSEALTAGLQGCRRPPTAAPSDS